MALLLRTIINNYNYVNDQVAGNIFTVYFFTKKVFFHYFSRLFEDPRTNNWFLIGSPWGPLAIVVVYLYFIQVLGPRLMEGRKPFRLERIVQIYDVMQVLINAYLFSMAVIFLKDNNFRCEPLDYSYSPKALVVSYLFLK